MLPREFLCFSLDPPLSVCSQSTWPLTAGSDQGQGGAQAIEDGQALELIFSSIATAPLADEVDTHLTLFEGVRKDRASTMQIYSSAGQDEAAKIQAAAREYVKNGKIPSKSHAL